MKKIFLTITFILIFALTLALPVYAALESVSLGMSYTLSANPSGSYADDGKMLTDGIHGTKVGESYHKSGTYVGIPATSIDENGCFSVTVDLGEVKTDITGFDLYYACETDANVYAPEYSEFFVSEDGENYTVAGKVMSGESNDAGITKAGVINCRLNAGVKARYVKFVIKNPLFIIGEPESVANVGWMFIDEVSVLQDDGKTPEMGDMLIIPVINSIGVICAAGGTALLIYGKKKKQNS